MKNALTIALACIAAYMLVSSTAFGAGGPQPKPLPKAKTIAELAARYDSSSCIECHEEIHEEWSESLHSKSILGSPRTAPTIITAIDKGLKLFPYSGVKEDSDITVESLMMCMKCHLPQMDEATDDVAREIVATIRNWQQAYRDEEYDKAEKLEKTIASLNIGCMVCHNKVALIHKYADGYPQPDTVYGAQTVTMKTNSIRKWPKHRRSANPFFAGSAMARVPILNSIIPRNAPRPTAAISLPMSPMAAVKPARNAICTSLNWGIICSPTKMKP